MQVPATVPTLRPRARQDRQALWQALNSMLGLMDTPAMAHLLAECFPGQPAFLDIACQDALSGAPVAWPVLSCLKHVFNTLGCRVHSGDMLTKPVKLQVLCRPATFPAEQGPLAVAAYQSTEQHGGSGSTYKHGTS